MKSAFVAVAIFILSFWLILTFKIQDSMSIWLDESITILAIESYNKTPFLDLSTVLPSGEMYQCYLFCRSAGLIADPVDINSYRLMATLFGLLGLVIVGSLTYLLSSSARVALLATTCLAFTPLYLSWSSSIRGYSLFLTLFWLTLLVTYIGSRVAARWRLLVSLLTVTVLTIITLSVHLLAILLPLLIGLIYTSHKKICHLATIVLGLLGLIATLYFWLYPTALTPSFTFPYYAVFILKTYGLFLLPALVSWYFFAQHERVIGFLFFAYLTYLLPLSLLTDIVHLRYLFHLSPAIIIAGVLGMTNITNFLKVRYSPLTAFAVVLLYVSLLVSSGQLTLNPATIVPYEVMNFGEIELHTPQAPWEDGYLYIKEHSYASEVVISSFPTFSHLLLKQTGIWLAHDLLYDDTDLTTRRGFDPYVGSPALWTNEELLSITNNRNGFIILDDMAVLHMSSERSDFINQNYTLVFTKTNQRTNDSVYVYSF